MEIFYWKLKSIGEKKHNLPLILQHILGNGGFGFTITSRETAKGERLFYIGNVKADGAAVNKLRAGDRLLQVITFSFIFEIYLFKDAMDRHVVVML